MYIIRKFYNRNVFPCLCLFNKTLDKKKRKKTT